MLQRLNFHRNIMKSLLDDRQCPTEVFDTHFGFMLSGHQQNAIKTHSFNRRDLSFNLHFIQCFTLDSVIH
ncbi:Uncharacterised protein [Vibrio cholerae]|nr:Uncharacterised protein [Vibrio cholerae]CSD12507.1 Uncharacterised protein [Vibrio cholerae]